jgi:aldose 1-epimerase
MNRNFFAGIAFVAAIAVAAQAPPPKGPTHVKSSIFGELSDGREAHLYTLANKNGMEVAISDYGATIVSIKVPDRKGNFADVALGYDSPKGYATGDSYFGGTIGRYGNRIAHGQFTLDGHTYNLAKNNGENSLHGGAAPFNKAMWTATEIPAAGDAALRCTYISKDGEGGYPGNLSVRVTFTLTEKNELKIEYFATTDKDTVLNLTNHSYFNLAGEGSGDVLAQVMQLHASRFTPVDETLIPTGELRKVEGTPFDFREATAIGSRIEQDEQQLKYGRGYDHNWVLDEGAQGSLVAAAEAYDPASGRVMDVLTTEPGIQFYTGNFLDGTIHGKAGKVYGHRGAFCLETQHFPDSPNHPAFPSTELKPGMKFESTTIYRFSTR